MPPAHPAREILRATATTGATTVVNILFGILRTKVVALVMGPAGVGLFGILTTLLHTGRGALARGLSTAGAREIAAASTATPPVVSQTVAAVRSAALLLALGGAALIIASSPWLSDWAFNESGHTWHVAALGIAIFFAVLAASRDAVLTGLGKIHERSICLILAGAASTLIAVVGVWQWGFPALVIAVVALPLMDFLFLSWRADRSAPPDTAVHAELARERIRTIAFTGLTLSAVVLISGGTQLAVRRYLITAEGITQAGLYHAAISISVLYIGVVLNSMTVDYMPRLSRIHLNRIEAERVVNQQLEISLHLIAPLCIAGIAFSPLVISLLYTDEFRPAAGMLRWQMLGEAIKAPLWIMASVLLVKDRKLTYLAIEGASNLLYFGSFVVLYPRTGLNAGGQAFLIANLAGALAYYLILSRFEGMRPAASSLRPFGVLLIVLSAILALTYVNFWLTATLCIALCFVYGRNAYRAISRRMTP